MQKKYSCQIYNVLKISIFLFPLYVFATVILIFLGRFLNLPPVLGVFLIILIWVLPFFFEKKIKAKFTKNVLLEFNNDHFSLSILKLGNEESTKNLSFKWDEIKSYKFYFTPSKLTYLDLFFKNGTFKEFGFKDDKTEEESIKTESVFSIFYAFVNAYNLGKEEEFKIHFIPGLFARKTGSIILWILGLLTVTDIILHILKYNTNYGFIIFGATFFLSILAKRSQQKSFYERMIKLDMKSIPDSI